MLRASTKIFDGQVLRLDLVGGATDRRIRTVIVLNNTPYFLYVGSNPQPGREDALFVVQPYSDVTMPVDVAQQLYMLEGPAIGTVPANCQAFVMWGPDVYQMASRKTERNVVIPIFAGNVNGTQNSNLTAQGLNGGAGLQPFAVPASATRRSIYGITNGALTSAVLKGSPDGDNWIVLSDLQPNGGGFRSSVPADTALPPYLMIEMQGVNIGTQVWMVVDL